MISSIKFSKLQNQKSKKRQSPLQANIKRKPLPPLEPRQEIKRGGTAPNPLLKNNLQQQLQNPPKIFSTDPSMLSPPLLSQKHPYAVRTVLKADSPLPMKAQVKPRLQKFSRDQKDPKRSTFAQGGNRPPTRYKQGQKKLGQMDKVDFVSVFEKLKKRPKTRYNEGEKIPIILNQEQKCQRRISTANKFSSRRVEEIQSSLDKEFLCLFN